MITFRLSLLSGLLATVLVVGLLRDNEVDTTQWAWKSMITTLAISKTFYASGWHK